MEDSIEMELAGKRRANHRIIPSKGSKIAIRRAETSRFPMAAQQRQHLDRKTRKHVTRKRHKDLQRPLRNLRLRHRPRDFMGCPKIHRTTFDRKKEEIRYKTMGPMDRFQAPQSVDIRIMLHPFLCINLYTLGPQKQENPFNEQLSHQGNQLIIRRHRRKHARLATLFS